MNYSHFQHRTKTPEVFVSAGVFAALSITAPCWETRRFQPGIRPILSLQQLILPWSWQKAQGGLRLDALEGALADLRGHSSRAKKTGEASELDPAHHGSRCERENAAEENREESHGRRDRIAPAMDSRWGKLSDALVLCRSPAARHPRSGTRDVVGKHWIVHSVAIGSRKDDAIAGGREVCTRPAGGALDLTGLPPTLEEADAFVNDKAPEAYERFVDRLLAKPAYGEHAARLWLDLARYADSTRVTPSDHSAHHLAVPRLRHSLLQRQQAVRPVHDRTDCRRPAAETDGGAAHRHGVPPQHDDEQRRRHERRGVPQRCRGGPREHDDDRLDGHVDHLCPVPQPQVRSDFAEGIAPGGLRDP